MLGKSGRSARALRYEAIATSCRVASLYADAKFACPSATSGCTAHIQFKQDNMMRRAYGILSLQPM